MSAELCFLVVDGYTKAGREDLESGGATTAGFLYRDMLQGCLPGCEVDIIYPADSGVSLPTDTELQSYHGLACCYG